MCHSVDFISAKDCLDKMLKLVKGLEKTLGPDTGDLGLRAGKELL